jgi:hypothetical protein
VLVRRVRDAFVLARVFGRPDVHGRPLRVRLDGRPVSLGADLLGRRLHQRRHVRRRVVRARVRDVLRGCVLPRAPRQPLHRRPRLRDLIAALEA